MAFDKDRMTLDTLKKEAKARIQEVRKGGGAGKGTAVFWAAKDLICLTDSKKELENVQASIRAIDPKAAPTETEWTFDKAAGGFVLKQAMGALLGALVKASETAVWAGKAPARERPSAALGDEEAKTGSADVFLLKLREPDRLLKQLRRLIALNRKDPEAEMFLWGIESAKDGRPMFILDPKPKADNAGTKVLRGAPEKLHVRARVRYKGGALLTSPVGGGWRAFAMALRKELQGKVSKVLISPKEFKAMTEDQLNAAQQDLDVSEADAGAVAFEAVDPTPTEETADEKAAAEKAFKRAARADRRGDAEMLQRLDAAEAQAQRLQEDFFRLIIRPIGGPSESEKEVKAALAEVAKRDPFIYETLTLLRGRLTTIDAEFAACGMGKKERLEAWALIPTPLRTGKLNPRRAEFYKSTKVREELLAGAEAQGDITNVIGDLWGMAGAGANWLGNQDVTNRMAIVDIANLEMGAAGGVLGLVDGPDESPLKRKVAESKKLKNVAGLGLDVLGSGMGIAGNVVSAVPGFNAVSAAAGLVKTGMELVEANSLRMTNNRALLMHQARNNPNQALRGALVQDQGVQKTRMVQGGVAAAIGASQVLAGLAPGIGTPISVAAGLASSASNLAFRVNATQVALAARSAEARARGEDAGEADELAAFQNHPHYAKIELALSAKRGDPEAAAWFEARGVPPGMLRRDDSTLADLVDIAMSAAGEDANPTTIGDDLADARTRINKALDWFKSEATRLKELAGDDPTQLGPLFATELQAAIATSTGAVTTVKQAFQAVQEAAELARIAPTKGTADANKALEASRKALTEAIADATRSIRDNNLGRRWTAQVADLKAMIEEDFGPPSPNESAQQVAVRAFGKDFPTQVTQGLEVLTKVREQVTGLIDQAKDVDAVKLSPDDQLAIRIKGTWDLGEGPQAALVTALRKQSGASTADVLASLEPKLARIRTLVGPSPTTLPAMAQLELTTAGMNLGNLEAEIEQAEVLVTAGRVADAEAGGDRVKKIRDYAKATGLANHNGLVAFQGADKDLTELIAVLEKAAEADPALGDHLGVLRVQQAAIRQATEAMEGIIAVCDHIDDRSAYALDITGAQDKKPPTYKEWKEATTLLGEGRGRIQVAQQVLSSAEEVLNLLNRAAEAGADDAERKALLGELREKRDTLQKLCKELAGYPKKLKAFVREQPKDDYERWTQKGLAAFPQLSDPSANDKLVSDLGQFLALYKLAKRDAPAVEPGRPAALFANDKQMRAFFASTEGLSALVEQLDALQDAVDKGAPWGGDGLRQKGMITRYWRLRAAEVATHKATFKKVDAGTWRGPFKAQMVEMDEMLGLADETLAEIEGRLQRLEAVPVTVPTPIIDEPGVRHWVDGSFAAAQKEHEALLARLDPLPRAPTNREALRKDAVISNRRAMAWIKQFKLDQTALIAKKKTLKGERFAVDLSDCDWALARLLEMSAAYNQAATLTAKAATTLAKAT